MELQYLIKTASYIEFVNKIDNLINDLLYSSQNGYYNLISKNALLSAKEVIQNFNYEADKLTKEYSFSDIQEVVIKKRNELVNLIRKHYRKELTNWIYRTFEEAVNNELLKVSINQNDEIMVNNSYKKLISSVLWLSKGLEFSDDKKEQILKEINKKFEKALNSKDKDFISLQNPLNSDCSVFLKLRNLISDDTNKFCTLDLNDYKLKLTNKDMMYFQRIQISLKQNKTSVFDEINLVDYATNKLKLDDDKSRYDFIAQVSDDFELSKDKTFENLAELIKKRYELFSNKDNYFQKLLGF